MVHLILGKWFICLWKNGSFGEKHLELTEPIKCFVPAMVNKRRHTPHDPEKWRDADAHIELDAAGLPVVVFASMSQPLPALTTFRGVHPQFHSRLQQASNLHASRILSLAVPPP